MKDLSITLQILPLLMYSERAVCRSKKFLGCTAVEMLCLSVFHSLQTVRTRAVAKETTFKK